MLVAQERVAVGDHEVGPAEDTHEVGRSDDLELVGGGRRGSETARVTENGQTNVYVNTVYRLLKRKQWGATAGLNKRVFNLN